MQERRATIRTPHVCRAQYCPADDLLPRDGRITNLSEQGVGLLVREAYRSGEQVTVGFSLPGEREVLTATGVVRWSASEPLKGRWYPLGLEWLSLEEATRHRLHEFLAHRIQRTPAPSAAFQSATVGVWNVGPSAWRSAGLAGLLLILAWGVWIDSAHRRQRQLEIMLEQRNTLILRLKQREAQAARELMASRTYVSATSGEVARLSQEAALFQAETERLDREIERFQQSYERVHGEREELMQRLLDVKQERALLARSSISLPELHQAIREAVEVREGALRDALAQTSSNPLIAGFLSVPSPGSNPAHQQERERVSAEPDRPPSNDRNPSGQGNGGYVIRDGQPTPKSSTVWVRVHDLER
ncbi:MAG: PilZ domain-containing protein [Candidatus Omnitrophica bacterium]|nr:PilZ domain-containing protein [Candidatus Omnitrophota bacterium]